METVNFVVDYPNESIKWLDFQFQEEHPSDYTFINLFQKYFNDMTVYEFLSEDISDKVFYNFENECIHSSKKLSPDQLETVYRNLIYLYSSLDCFIKN